MSTLLTPGRAVKWIGDDGGWKVGKVLEQVDINGKNWFYIQALDGVHCVESHKVSYLALRSEYEAAE